MAPPVKKIVAKGSRCNNTAAIQNAINWMNQGRNNLKLDGIYGDNTESAVKTFQRACGLLDDGKVGDFTGGRLFEVVDVVQTLTLDLPANAFDFTGKSPRLPPLLDTAGALLTRRKAIQAWSELARQEKTGLEVPKLELRHIGLKTASMMAHGIVPKKLQTPLAALEKLTLEGTLPQSLQLIGTTKDLKNLTITYRIDKIVQPRAPRAFSPHFKMEGAFDFDQQNRRIKGSWSTKVGIATPTLVLADWLEAGVNANLWASANGTAGMGGAAGQASAGVEVERKAVLHVLKTERPIGPIKRTQIDLFGGFNLGMAAHVSLDQDGATVNIVQPKLSPVLGVSLILTTF